MERTKLIHCKKFMVTLTRLPRLHICSLKIWHWGYITHCVTHCVRSQPPMHQLYFNRLPRLWKSLPCIGLGMSVMSIKRKPVLATLYLQLWPWQCLTYHFLCPCIKCSRCGVSLSTTINEACLLFLDVVVFVFIVVFLFWLLVPDHQTISAGPTSVLSLSMSSSYAFLHCNNDILQEMWRMEGMESLGPLSLT